MGHGLLTLLNIVIKVTCEIVCCFDLSSDLYSYSVHDDIFFKQYLNIKNIITWQAYIACILDIEAYFL